MAYMLLLDEIVRRHHLFLHVKVQHILQLMSCVAFNELDQLSLQDSACLVFPPVGSVCNTDVCIVFLSVCSVRFCLAADSCMWSTRLPPPERLRTIASGVKQRQCKGVRRHQQTDVVAELSWKC